jgi:hypothetical protein
VSFTVGLRATSWATVEAARHVIVHLLADSQEDVARRFARRQCFSCEKWWRRSAVIGRQFRTPPEPGENRRTFQTGNARLGAACQVRQQGVRGPPAGPGGLSSSCRRPLF